MTTTFPPEGIPASGELLLITDELSSPADFLLHRLFAAHVKRSNAPPEDARCIILSVSENLVKWKYIAGKSVSSFLYLRKVRPRRDQGHIDLYAR